MPVKIAGATTDQNVEVDSASKAMRMTLYDTSGNPIAYALGATKKVTYTWIVPSAAVTANKLFCSMFNAADSGQLVTIMSVRPIADTDVAVAPSVGVRLCLYRTDSKGTGGTAWNWRNATLDVAGGCLSPQDTTSTNLTIAGKITGMHLPTAGANITDWIRGCYIMTEETATSLAYIFQGQHNMLDLDDSTAQLLLLRPGEGILIKQGAVASAGNVRFRITFTVE